jgi:hypothetical protein
MTYYDHCLKCGNPKGHTNKYFCAKCSKCPTCIENIVIRCERNPTLRKLLLEKLSRQTRKGAQL